MDDLSWTRWCVDYWQQENLNSICDTSARKEMTTKDFVFSKLNMWLNIANTTKNVSGEIDKKLWNLDLFVEFPYWWILRMRRFGCHGNPHPKHTDNVCSSGRSENGVRILCARSNRSTSLQLDRMMFVHIGNKENRDTIWDNSAGSKETMEDFVHSNLNVWLRSCKHDK